MVVNFNNYASDGKPFECLYPCKIPESPDAQFVLGALVRTLCWILVFQWFGDGVAEKVRVMLLCGTDLLESIVTPGVWIPDQVS